MVAPRTKIPNDISNEVFYAAVESAPGVVPASGWFRFNGQPDINSTPTILDEQDTTGTFVRKANPAKGMTEHAGTWGGTASYERLPSVLRAVLQSGGTPTISDAPSYTYQQDAAMLYDDSDTYAMIHNVQGDLYRARGVRYGDFNLSGSLTDANQMWQYGGTLQMVENDQLPMELIVITSATATVLTITGASYTPDELIGAWIYPNPDTNTAGAREIIDNTADTITVSTAFDVLPVAGDTFLITGLPPAGVSALSEEKIRFPGTKLFLDPFGADGSDLGTTQILKRFIGFNVSANLNLDPKDFAEDVDSHSGVYGRGELLISGQIRLEADRPDEFRQLKALDELSLRIQQEGSELEAGVRKMAQVDLPRIMWTQRTRDTRNNNKTQTMAFWGYYHVPVLRVTTRNGLSALP